MVNIVFDARTIHGARNVSIHKFPDSEEDNVIDKQEIDTLQELWEEAGSVNRVAFVQYFPHSAVYRTGNFSTCPSVHFGNTGTLSRSDAAVKTFSGDGEHILGTKADAKSRLAREAVFSFYNTLAQTGLFLPGMSATQLLNQICYQEASESDSSSLLWKGVQPLELDATVPAHRERIFTLHSYLSWYYQLRQSLLLNISQNDFFSIQRELAKTQNLSSLKDSTLFAQKPVDYLCSVNIPSTNLHLSVQPAQAISSKEDSFATTFQQSIPSTSTSEFESDPTPLLNHPKRQGKTRLAVANPATLQSSSGISTPSALAKGKSVDRKRAASSTIQKLAFQTKKARTKNQNVSGLAPDDPGLVSQLVNIGRQTYGDYLVEKIVDHVCNLIYLSLGKNGFTGVLSWIILLFGKISGLGGFP
ncbi:hypothetical protein VKT23_000081 [Stygiomarasmius scandens]|uniref:Uncharacterized protein n=1 Tax=Marasmiellus scandens TaxID=2682957 RepID=A0ABR1K326_9AGAR